jgi:hypothetical protein
MLIWPHVPWVGQHQWLAEENNMAIGGIVAAASQERGQFRGITIYPFILGWRHRFHDEFDYLFV